MRSAALCLIAPLILCPLWASAANYATATAHLTYTWKARSSSGTGETGATEHKDYKLTPEAIAKLPLYRDVKITVNDSGEVAAPDKFLTVLTCETEREVITYKGTFTKAFFRDTFTPDGDPLVLFSPYLPKDWSDGIPVSDSLPPEFDCQWGGDNGTDFAPRRNECFGVVVQLYNRHTQWLRARFTGTITKKSKSWFGSSSTQHLHDTAVQFPPNTTVTAKLMASAPYRF